MPNWDVFNVHSGHMGPLDLRLNVPAQELINTRGQPRVEFKGIELGEFVMDIETPKVCGLGLRLVFKSDRINHSTLEVAHETLWNDLDGSSAEHFFRYWRYILRYQRSKIMPSILHGNAEVLSSQDVQDTVIKYKCGGINYLDKKDVGLRVLPWSFNVNCIVTPPTLQ